MTLEATPLRPANPLYLGTPLRLDFNLEMINMCSTAKFVKQLIPNIKIMCLMSAYSTPHHFPLSEFVYDAKSIYNLDCGKLSKKLYLSKTNSSAPDWMSVSDQQITLNFKTQTSTYHQAIDLFVSLEDYPFVNTISTFNATLSDS